MIGVKRCTKRSACGQCFEDFFSVEDTDLDQVFATSKGAAEVSKRPFWKDDCKLLQELEQDNTEDVSMEL